MQPHPALAVFNSGKPLATAQTNGGYVTERVKVIGAKLVMGNNESSNPYLNDPMAVFLELSFKSEGGVTFESYQKLKFNEEGAVVNYAYPRYTNKNGELIAASLCYDVLHKAKEYDPKQSRDDTEFSPAKFVNLIFKLDLKAIESKGDGTLVIIPKFDRQALKDEEYAKSKQATQSSTLDAPSDFMEDNSSLVEAAFGAVESATVAPKVLPVQRAGTFTKPIATNSASFDNDLPF